jgi:tripartite-type tricarboxylate transporter receptor subunit TctC
MIISRRTATGIFTAGLTTALMPRTVLAQTFPTKPMRIVVPYPAGGPTDALARIIAAELQATYNQSVVVENKPGASGAVGTREVARADPDGHTLVLGNNQTHATNAYLLKDAGYDPIKDFAPIAGLADLQHALVVRKDLGVKTVAELIAWLKKDPGKANYGSTGVGSGSHLAMELFKTRTGTSATHVPFRGAAPMALEIVAGRIDLAFATLPSVLGQVQAGEILALAIASGVRAPQLPDVPLLAEQGVKDAEADSWLALFAPAQTPAAVRASLGEAVAKAMSKADVVAGAVKQGIAINPRAATAFATYHTAEMTKWADVIRTAGVKIDG